MSIDSRATGHDDECGEAFYAALEVQLAGSPVYFTDHAADTIAT
jgi:hypothetical protein